VKDLLFARKTGGKQFHGVGLSVQLDFPNVLLLGPVGNMWLDSMVKGLTT
jgi:hypothetical protein